MQEYFAIIDDPRHQGYVKHKLEDILTIVMCAVLCGMDELCDVMTFAQNKAEFFRQNFGIERIPSKPTVSRILGIVDGKKVAETVIPLMRERAGEKGDVIAVDGKAIRSTSKEGKPHSALQVITAYLTESGVVLGQEKIHEKTNEIPVFQEMLGYLNVKGKTVTADAMHCQRETCASIMEKGGDYAFGLKENQKSLHDDVELFFEKTDEGSVETFTTTEKNGGRIEKRVCRKIRDAGWLGERHGWPGLKTVFSVERTIEARGKTTRETEYYITSSPGSAEELLKVAREHWKVESMHWMLDVVFSEDECRFFTENAHLTMNIFRKYALALHKKYLAGLSKKTKPSVKQNLLNCLLNESLLLEIISMD